MGALVNMQKGGGDGCRRAFSRGLTSLIRRKPVDSVHTRSETRGLARRLSLVDLIAIGIIQTSFFHILDLENYVSEGNYGVKCLQVLKDSTLHKVYTTKF
ncbi:hypothetical protein CK203_085914 [Vitis vinifera]|uniref:Uncharacterized protein n=1 Tax=Vitis vinifera TaxID=29760 RepID=A0A438DIE4_VITVI|nr:hypothetical protein CK203_085914 [Vitis vinifera]